MSEKRFIISKNTGERFPTGIIDVERQTHLWVVEVVDLLNEQAERIRENSIRIYCQDKEIQRLLGELEKIPKSIREVWLEE